MTESARRGRRGAAPRRSPIFGEGLRHRGAVVLIAALLALNHGPALAQDGVGSSGISADDYERMTPQAPRALAARRLPDGTVEIRWSPPPPPPEGRLGYERGFARYRVYRLADGQQTTIAETEGLSAVDSSPIAAGGYVVVTVRPSGLESARPDLVVPQ